MVAHSGFLSCELCQVFKGGKERGVKTGGGTGRGDGVERAGRPRRREEEEESRRMGRAGRRGFLGIQEGPGRGTGRQAQEKCLICFLLLSCANRKENESAAPRQGGREAGLTHSSGPGRLSLQPPPWCHSRLRAVALVLGGRVPERPSV